MPEDFYSSDTHYTHERTLKLSRRPFANVTDMDETMILRTNAACRHVDTLYHLGDFGDYRIVSRLVPRVILICGNYEHDDINKFYGGDFQEFRKRLMQLGFKDVILNSMGHRGMWLNHFPNGRVEDRFNLFGHIHRLQMVKHNGLNVGVDCHDYAPVSMETVEFYRDAIQNHYDDEVFNP
ncbi:putative metallophosphoesterase [Erwinia phage pEa_SNUABM_5]|uniref:Putative metallophosphoesterase n=1 Tax=Erwinia phage pEa_SNUABM_5 TaxID=2797313 RepID=A0A7T8EPP1_9CAUD|nr:putative metallophosphoesterase [Erwinia phage pEa_SNUABM_5]QQO90383.1 putative metallophosphoesterase [Erwinia phage pEa_SNUABM_5]